MTSEIVMSGTHSTHYTGMRYAGYAKKVVSVHHTPVFSIYANENSVFSKENKLQIEHE